MTERILNEVLELDLDKCTNTFGVSPCTAGRKDSGTAQAGGASTITLRAGASAVDSFYNNMTVRIVSGTGAGQEGKVASYVGATKVATMTAAWGVAPNATSVYDVIDRPNACYNTFRTCQATSTFVKGTRTVKFCGQGAPANLADPARPYITAVSRAATELSLADGLAVRGSSTITLIDEPDSDVELDPYVRDRATPAKGTFFGRLLARNLNYGGRQARLKQNYVDRGSFGSVETERYIIEQMKGPDNRGQVQITLKDASKVIDRAVAPTPTSGKLIADMSASDLVIRLGSGEGAQYTATGYVRIGEEIIRYSSNSGDVLGIGSSTNRGQFGTDGSDAKSGDGVQQCLVYQNSLFSAVIEDLLNRGGIVDSDIDLTQLASEDTTWLGEAYRVTACISDPEEISGLLGELLTQAQALLWWSPTAQKMKFKVFAPQSPSAVITKTLDETGYIREESVRVTREDDERITLSAIYFGRSTATANVDEPKSYKIGEIAIDVGAESANEYNERRTQVRTSRWFTSANLLAMRAFVRRDVARHRDAPEDVEFELDPKDRDVIEGAVIDAQISNLVDSAGNTKTSRLFVTRRENDGKRLRIKARRTTFDQRYGFISPNGTPDYPGNLGYACVSQNTGLMTDGSAGFLII